MKRIYLIWMIFLPFALFAQDHPGKSVYDKYCNQCHGKDGDGKGYAHDFVLPRPRDFTTGVFKFRSTGNQYLPTDADLKRVIVDGIYGTSMPSFAHIGDENINQVVAYIKTFFMDRIERDKKDNFYPPKEVTIGTPPTVTDAMIASGKKLYIANGCGDCHGHDGRADGPSSPSLLDDYDNPIKPANLKAAWRFRAGATLTDIYRAFSTGLSGTPMPSYEDSLSSEQRWELAAYVDSLSSDIGPDASPQVVAKQVGADLPTTYDDPMWQNAEQAWFPLVGQVIWEPINTVPTVFGVDVRALHNGDEIALLLEWEDPTYSLEGMSLTGSASDDDDEWGEEEESSEEEDDWGDEEESSAPASITIVNDSFAIQFPSGQPLTNEKPYLVMGDSKSAVNLWRWTNSEAIAEQPFSGADDDPWKKYYQEYTGEPVFTSQIAKGREQISEVTDGEIPAGSIKYLNGRWHMVIKRKLSSAQGKEVQITEGQFIPMSFWAWDGHNGEVGPKAALSAWYYLVLEQKVQTSAYYKIGLAILITVILQFMAVRSAHNKSRRPAEYAGATE